jgi:hypothetical protein
MIGAARAEGGAWWQDLFHQGDQTSLAPASSAKRLGLRASLTFQYLLIKVHLEHISAPVTTVHICTSDSPSL